MKSDSFLPYLLESTNKLPSDVFNFTHLKIECISLLTEKAVELFFNVNGKNYKSWIPFSQLRKDNQNEIWVANWLLNKLKEKKEAKFPPQNTSTDIVLGDPTEDYRI
jgi:hypothetical protein